MHRHHRYPEQPNPFQILPFLLSVHRAIYLGLSFTELINPPHLPDCDVMVAGSAGSC